MLFRLFTKTGMLCLELKEKLLIKSPYANGYGRPVVNHIAKMQATLKNLSGS